MSVRWSGMPPRSKPWATIPIAGVLGATSAGEGFFYLIRHCVQVVRSV